MNTIKNINNINLKEKNIKNIKNDDTNINKNISLTDINKNQFYLKSSNNINIEKFNSTKNIFINTLHKIINDKSRYSKLLKTVSTFYNEPIYKISLQNDNNTIILYRKFIPFFPKKSSINLFTLSKIII
jgi:hypothetical protein